MRMGKLALFALTSLSIPIFAETQVITLNPGWNLKGSLLDGVNTSQDLNQNGIITVWKWEENKWAVWSPIPKLKTIIEKYVNQGKLKHLTVINAGEGFWVNSLKGLKITLNGLKPSSTTIHLNPGWNLIALKSEGSVKVEEIFQNIPGIITVWKWEEGKWAVWSPIPKLKTIIEKYVNQGKLKHLTVINAGEGFWVNSQQPANIETGTEEATQLEAPPTVLAFELVNKLNLVPIKDAEVYINGKKVGKTDYKGSFALKDIKEGDTVTIVKKGYITVSGKVKNGTVVLVTQKDLSPKVSLENISKSGELLKPISKIIHSSDGSVAVIISSYQTSKDITVSVSPVLSTAVVPPLNQIVGGESENLSPQNVAIVAGALINIETKEGNPLPTDEYNKLVKFQYKLKISHFLGDLEDLLNGNIKSSQYQKFTETVYKKIKDLMDKKQIDLVVLQYINGKWVYKGKAKLEAIEVMDKSGNKYKKYFIETDTLNTIAPTVIGLKLNYLIGETQVCVKEGGYKMFDGSIVTAPDSNSPNFNWIGKPIQGVVVIGDSAVQNTPLVTGKSGCVEVKYKVPFIKPTFTIAFKKNGYFDNSVTCEVNLNGANCPDAKLYRIPDTASIEGYVKDKLTQKGIKDALVTLVNPEVLSADKVKYGKDKDGYSYVKVGYRPNVKYTWTAIKYDNNGKKVAEIVIKEGKGKPEYAQLSEKEIFEKLIKPFENGKKVIDPKYLLGKWELHIKAEHTYTNTNTKFVEEGIGSFDLDILMPKLAEILGGQLSEKIQEVVVGPNGVLQEIPNSLKNIAIYGGPSVGFLYEVGPQLDTFEWRTQILAAGDENTGCINDVIANEYGECYIDVAKDSLIYKKALYPTVLNVKFIAKHFADLLKPDPTCENDPECKGHPFIQTGFTLRTLFHGKLEIPQQNGKTTTLEKYAASYIDVPYNLNRKIEDLVDIPQITLVAPSVTAYMRQVLTKDDGYYRINLIPPQLSGKLEIFAKAKGYKFDANTDIKLVNDLAPGKVSHYDLYLEPIQSGNADEVKPKEDWKEWKVAISPGCSPTVKWQVVEKPENIKVANPAWALKVWGTENISLLPDAYQKTAGYLWFGNKETGTFSDTKENTSTKPVCGMAITPTIDLSKLSLPVLKFKTWYEVESVDVAKGLFDQMEIGFIIPKAENGGKDKVKIYTSTGEEMELETDKYYSLKLLNPEQEPYIQNPYVPYSNMGVNALPKWMTISVPVDYLAGLKVKFVFKFNSKDSLYNGFRGWAIDDVKISNDVEEVIISPPVLPKKPFTIFPPSIPLTPPQP